MLSSDFDIYQTGYKFKNEVKESILTHGYQWLANRSKGQSTPCQFL
jgi:hypothetical protein